MMRLFTNWLVCGILVGLWGSHASAQQPTSLPSSTQPATQPWVQKNDLGYHLEPGPYPVQTVDELLLHDAKRNKDLPVKIRYPQGAPGPCPVLIFSHGAGGAGDAFPDLTTYWASYGYVVLLPTHADSIQLRRKNGSRLSAADLKSNPRQIIQNVQPMDRLEDVKLILDSFDTLEAQTPGLKDAHGKGLLDRSRIGMAGHSAGALTTQMAYGVKIRTLTALEPTDYGDPRIKAAILVSGQGLTNRMFTEKSWAELTKPLLVITGSEDQLSLTAETPETRKHPFVYAPPGDKYLLFIQGATHGSYAGKQTSRLLAEKPSGDIAMITATTACATLAYWDAYLKNEPAGKGYLQSDRLEAFSAGQAELKRK